MRNASTIPQLELFTIQELSQQSGLPEPTLRYYEKIGLIQPVPRDPRSGHRRYPSAIVGVVNALACLRASGLSIEDMRTYLRLLEQGTQSAAQQKELFQTHANALEREIEQLQSRKLYLEGKAAYWDALERRDTEAAQRITEENHRIAATLR
jgi:DNA-binding transcriptional MerR regulator